MRALSTEFDGRADQRGFRFTQVDRQGMVALFEKTKGTWKGWEVVHIRQIPETRFASGELMQAHEAMPKPEEWGSGGYSCHTLERAREVFAREVATHTDIAPAQ